MPYTSILNFTKFILGRNSNRRLIAIEKEARIKKAKRFAHKREQRRISLFESFSRVSICKWSCFKRIEKNKISQLSSKVRI
jgi:hypothetical protein